MRKKLLFLFFKVEFPYVLGIVLFFSMFYGLVVNTILPKIGVTHPLALPYIWPLYFLFLLIPLKFLANLVMSRRISLFSIIFSVLSLSSFFISILGVNLLNSFSDNRLSILSVFLIIFLFILIFIKKTSQEIVYKVSIFFSALSLIALNTMRSNYLVGWDIHQEFLVFRLTMTENLWSMDKFRDAYNACLSITILPTLIRNLTGLDQLVIFRIIYPLFLATIPIVVYLVGKRFLDEKHAYAGAFVFLIQSQFFSQLPALLRQGVAFLFFGLMLDLLVRSDITMKYRRILFSFFAIGMIISHYSTTYMTILILLLAKFALFFLNLLFKKSEKAVTTIPLLIFIILTTFVWNSLITNTSRGLISTVMQIVKHADESFTLENKSTMVKEVFNQKNDNQSLVNNFSTETLKKSTNQGFYSKYPIWSVSIDQPRFNPFSSILSVYFHSIIPWTFRVLILVGVFLFGMRTIKKKRSLEILSVDLAMLAIVLASIIVPYVSVNYNLERILQQLLFLLAPMSICMFDWSANRIIKTISPIFICILVTSYLLQTSNFIDRVISNSKSITFDNDGEQYYKYFTKKSEIFGLTWLDNNTDTDSSINIDRYSALRLKAYSTLKYKYIHLDLFPSNIGLNNYVVVGNTGLNKKAVFTQYKNQIIRYSLPEKYLSEQKNKIYSSSGEQIFR